MGRMIFRRTGAFLLAVVMAVAFVGIFAGNAAAASTSPLADAEHVWVKSNTDNANGGNVIIQAEANTPGAVASRITLFAADGVNAGDVEINGAATNLNTRLNVQNGSATSLSGTLGVTGAATLSSTLGVTGNLTANGTTNTIGTAGTSTNTITGVNNYITSTNTVSLVSDADDLSNNAHTKLNLQPTSATLLVNTDSGEAHGLDINQTRTVLSGGTSSTSMTLDDNGATFRNETTGGPARVTGVADGKNDFDAVNWRQLKAAYAGIASVAALAAIPEPVPGKNFAVGIGGGNFKNETAVAIGIRGRIPNTNVSLTAGLGYADDNCTTSAGFSVSF